MDKIISIEQKDIVYSDIQARTINISWGVNKVGFGNLYAYVDKESGILHFESENMGKEFIKSIFTHLIDNSCVNDFEKVITTTKDINLEELNKLQVIGNKEKHVVTMPYYISFDISNDYIHLFWNYDKDNVKVTLVNTFKFMDEESIDWNDIMKFCMSLQNIGFNSADFIKATIISNEIVERNS